MSFFNIINKRDTAWVQTYSDFVRGRTLRVEQDLQICSY